MATSSPALPAAAPAFRPSNIARGIAYFSGTVGLILKISLLAIANALVAWAAFVLVDHQRWPALAVVLVSTALIDWIYLVPHKWALPAKFLIPGTIFLVGFQVIPIIFTVSVAFSNYSTGHILAKNEAVASIKVNSLEPPPNGRQFDMAPARDSSGKLVLILHDEGSGKVYVGSPKGLTELPKAAVTISSTGVPSAAKGYTLIHGAELFGLDQQLGAYRVPTTGDASLQPQGTQIAVELKPTLEYDAKRNVFVRLSDGKVFHDITCPQEAVLRSVA